MRCIFFIVVIYGDLDIGVVLAIISRGGPQRCTKLHLQLQVDLKCLIGYILS